MPSLPWLDSSWSLPEPLYLYECFSWFLGKQWLDSLVEGLGFRKFGDDESNSSHLYINHGGWWWTASNLNGHFGACSQILENVVCVVACCMFTMWPGETGWWTWNIWHTISASLEEHLTQIDLYSEECIRLYNSWETLSTKNLASWALWFKSCSEDL